MLTAYLVDGITRIYLKPDDKHDQTILAKLSEAGHKIGLNGPVWSLDRRSAAEIERGLALLNSIGM